MALPPDQPRYFFNGVELKNIDRIEIKPDRSDWTPTPPRYQPFKTVTWTSADEPEPIPAILDAEPE